MNWLRNFLLYLDSLASDLCLQVNDDGGLDAIGGSSIIEDVLCDATHYLVI